MVRTRKGPEFIKYFAPIIAVLREIGGSGKPTEVTNLVVEKLAIPESIQQVTLASGQSRVYNQIAWARFYLAKAGVLESSLHGIWSLTEKGMKQTFSESDALPLFMEVQRSFKKTDKALASIGRPDAADDIPAIETAHYANYKEDLINTLQGLPASGFERICQRLLREAGFSNVAVTGKTGDGGIDGHGVLALNPFVTFKVLFQCKRYVGSVSSGQVRDFRGAMLGRADKGIIITTGSFTSEAIKEARRDGAPPIELVDGETLIGMFESYKLGLVPVTTYEIDSEFFAAFKREAI